MGPVQVELSGAAAALGAATSNVLVGAKSGASLGARGVGRMAGDAENVRTFFQRRRVQRFAWEGAPVRECGPAVRSDVG